MKKKWLMPAGFVLAPLAVICLYTILHEGGHALAALACGGKITKFDINFLTGWPHVNYTGNFSPGQEALINIAGPLFPWLIWLLILPFSKKSSSIPFRLVTLLFSLVTIASLLPNVILPLLFALGHPQPGEDVIKFITCSGWPPLLVSALFCGLLAFSLWYLLRFFAVQSELKRFKDYLRPQGPRPLLAVLFLFVVILGLRFVLVSSPQDRLGFTCPHNLELSFGDFREDKNEVLNLAPGDLVLLDLIYTIKSDFPVCLELVNLKGTGFLHQEESRRVLFQGTSASSSIFSGILLEPGHYTLQIETEDRQGLLKLDYGLRPADERASQWAWILRQVRAGTFREEMYQEDGYDLVYHEYLAGSGTKTIYIFPADVKDLRLSAFAQGEFTSLALDCLSGEEVVTSLNPQICPSGIGVSVGKEGSLVLDFAGAAGEVFVYVKE